MSTPARWLLGVSLALGAAQCGAAQTADGAEPAAPQQLDDQPDPLRPKQSRTDDEADRVEALTRFSMARIKEQQRDLSGALRLYQRAARYDPQSKAAYERAVTLAAQLDRADEASRYASRAAELGVNHPALFRTLAVELSEAEKFPAALKLFEASLDNDDEDRMATGRVLVRMEMGRLAYLAKNYKLAAESFDEVQEALKNPDDYGLDAALRKVLLGNAAQTYELFGEAYLEVGKAEAALAAFDKAAEASTEKELKSYFQARVQAQAKQHGAALERLDVYFAARPKARDTAPYDFLAEQLKAAGKSAELIPRLEKLHAADPENSFLGYYLAGEYRRAGQLDKARPLFEELVRDKPFAEGYRALAHIYREAKQDEPLLKLLGDIVAKSGDFDTLADDGKALLADGERLSALVTLARQRHKTDADNLDYGQRLAAAHVALAAKQYDAAGEFFALALKVKSDAKAEVMLSWGLGLLLAEQHARAADVFRRGIEQKVLPSDNPAFHFYLSGALALDNKHDEALAAARKAIALRDNDPRFAGRAAWVLYRAKKYAEAKAAYREVLEKFDGGFQSPEMRRVVREARLTLSNICVVENKLSEAEEWLEQVLDENPDDVGALNDLGYLWVDQNKRLARGTRMLEQAVREEPDNTAYRDSLGWAYYRLGRFDDARRELEKAVQGEEPDGVVLDHLGDAHYQLKQVDAARAMWTRAAAAFKKQDEPDKMKQAEDKLKRPAP